MNTIIYSLATEADIEGLIEMRIQFLEGFMGKQSDEAVLQLRTELSMSFAQALHLKTYIGWIAKDGDNVVGAGGITVRQAPGSFLNPSGIMGYVMSMYTVPEYRKRGICSAILSGLADTAKEMGIPLLELHASKEGEPVYQKHGFVLHDEPTYRKFLNDQ